MSWIAAQQSLLTHRKTIRATAMLKCDRHRFIGHILALWWWALDNADRDGSLKKTSALEIAEGAGWPVRRAEAFTEALVAVRFLEEIEGGFVLHNWGKHTHRFYDGQEKKEGASDAGKYGNHVRWHVEKGVVSEDCEYCIAPNRVANRPESGTQSLPHSPHSPNKPDVSDQPDIATAPAKLATRARLKARFVFTDEQWRDFIARHPATNPHARYWDWLDWIGESEGERMPRDPVAAFHGFLKKHGGHEYSAGGAPPMLLRDAAGAR